MSRQLHSTFSEVSIHTAKCDRCNRHNKDILYRCCSCGLQICTPCKESDAGDGTHVMNGGDRTIGGTPGQSPPLLASSKSTASTKAGRPERRRASTVPSATTAPGPSTQSSSTIVNQLRRTQSSRKRKSRAIIESDSDFSSSSDSEDTSLFLPQSRSHQPPRRLQYPYHNRPSPKRARSSTTTTPSSSGASLLDLDRLQATMENRAKADYLLTLASPDMTSSEPLSGGSSNSDASGLLLLIHAAEISEQRAGLQSEHVQAEDEEEEEEGQDAQARSPLIFPEDVDLALEVDLMTGCEESVVEGKKRAVSESLRGAAMGRERAVSEVPVRREWRLMEDLASEKPAVMRKGTEGLGEVRETVLVRRERGASVWA